MPPFTRGQLCMSHRGQLVTVEVLRKNERINAQGVDK